ncbi:MAG: hypothetical protein DHS20C21_01110 [Gemmatimonadota bacterium]|nr:MAG: hypothetical protein DHS20C21_01110 [Gemmatimonadota bacterium]
MPRPWRTAIVAALCLWAGSAAAGAADGLPNLVLIVAEQLEFPEDPSALPYLDRLANQGVRFVEAYSPSADVAAAETELMTGRYAWRPAPTDLPPDSPRSTLSGALRTQGYRIADEIPADAEAFATALVRLDRWRAQDPDRPYFLYVRSPLAAEAFDRALGALVDQIDASGAAGNTLILVTAATASTHHVPMAARWGDGTEEGSRIPPGGVSLKVVGLQDVLATVGELVRVPVGRTGAEDSESFLDELQWGDRRGRRPRGAAVPPVREGFVFQRADGRFAIRQAHWKLVVDLDPAASSARMPLSRTGQLFDLRSDPAERVDLAAHYPSRVRSLAEDLNRFRESGTSTTQTPNGAASPLRRGRPGQDEEVDPGRWRELPGAADLGALTPEQEAQLEQLKSIGYLGGVVEDERSGVSFHDPQLAQDGANFYSSGDGEVAILMDMDGEVLHRWSASLAEIFPDSDMLEQTGAKWWRRARLFDNGDILAIYEGIAIIKLDKDSNVLWARENRAHHDVEVQPNGDLVLLTREPRVIPEIHETAFALEDFITILDSDGREKRRVSIWEAFRNSDFLATLQGGRVRTGDIFHTNTIHVLDGSLEDRLPAFRRGDVLTSLNAKGVLAVVSLDEPTVRWAVKSDPQGQHDPRILANGNLLLFDNRLEFDESVVVEMDPATGEAVWEYRGTELLPFHSRTCGAASRLANGNTLITESDGGRALEVTPDGAIVWEFYNPARSGDQGRYIATLSEVERIDWAEVDAWLD